jgi:hypothetical protein
MHIFSLNAEVTAPHLKNNLDEFKSFEFYARPDVGGNWL